jgi:2-aminoadipate transaminase
MVIANPLKMIDMTRGMPPVSTFPIDDLVRCSETALRQHGSSILQYTRSPGFPPLREWLAEYHQVKPAQVFMGNSSLEILDFLLQFELKPGGRVFIERPTYDRTILLMHRYGASITDIPLENDGMDLNIFEQELSRGIPALVYIIADFQNPTGLTTNLEKRRQLAKWAEQYGFWIVEDAPYRPLRYVGEELPTLMDLAPQYTLHMSSLSKQLAPGTRTGYLLGPEKLISNMVNKASDTYIGPVTLAQGIVYEYCRQGLLQANISKLKELYYPKLKALLAALEKHMPQATWTHPEGGYYVAVNLPPRGKSMQHLMGHAADVGLKLSDGRGFFLNPQDGEYFLRIPFCSIALDDIETAVMRVAELLA